jgi:hypothetical protein
MHISRSSYSIFERSAPSARFVAGGDRAQNKRICFVKAPAVA